MRCMVTYFEEPGYASNWVNQWEDGNGEILIDWELVRCQVLVQKEDIEISAKDSPLSMGGRG